MRLPDFIIQRQPTLEEVRASGLGEGKGRQRQPISGLTTRQMTGPEANPGPPAHQPRLPGSCGNGVIRLECLGLAGIFLPWKPVLHPKEPFLEKSGTKVKGTQ